MAYVQPNSIVQLFKGINLDNRYMHTIYFANTTTQTSWFTNKVFKTYSQQSYTRYTRNQIKIKEEATALFGCTYLRFMNDRANDKWFYAFILNIEYVNENTSLITYEVDVMQTWYIQNGTINPCMVLREHVTDDTFGTNLETEPVGSEIYDFDFITRSEKFNNYSVVLSTSAQPNNNFDWGLYCGTNLQALSCNSSSDCANITTAIENTLGSWDLQAQSATLVDLYTYPTDLMDDTYPFALKAMNVIHPQSFNGYTPKNNKMYGYPFSYLLGTTMNGDSEMFKWEYWAGNRPNLNVTFGIISNPLGGGMVECYPRDYNGIEENYDCGLVIDNFPKNSANIDAYHAWVASGGQTRLQNESFIQKLRNSAEVVSTVGSATQNIVQGTTNVAKGIAKIGTGVGAVSGANDLANAVNNYAQATSSILNTSADVREANYKIDYQWKDASYRPNIISGKNTPNLGVSWRTLDFNFFHAHIRNDEAKRIDDFLSMFGYNVNRVKAPNITGRSYWNFVQTQNSVISGDMPASSKEAIGRIFDGGITFWHNGDNIGNYAISVSDGTINNPIA